MKKRGSGCMHQTQGSWGQPPLPELGAAWENTREQSTSEVGSPLAGASFARASSRPRSAPAFSNLS